MWFTWTHFCSYWVRLKLLILKKTLSTNIDLILHLPYLYADKPPFKTHTGLHSCKVWVIFNPGGMRPSHTRGTDVITWPFKSVTCQTENNSDLCHRFMSSVQRTGHFLSIFTFCNILSLLRLDRTVPESSRKSLCVYGGGRCWTWKVGGLIKTGKRWFITAVLRHGTVMVYTWSHNPCEEAFCYGTLRVLVDRAMWYEGTRRKCVVVRKWWVDFCFCGETINGH